MTKSETLIAESKTVVCQLRTMKHFPALADFIERLTEEYRIAIAQGLEAEETIHRLTKGEK